MTLLEERARTVFLVALERAPERFRAWLRRELGFGAESRAAFTILGKILVLRAIFLA
jgi:hypothetical protein